MEGAEEGRRSSLAIAHGELEREEYAARTSRSRE
jgi:hypothetical protein